MKKYNHKIFKLILLIISIFFFSCSRTAYESIWQKKSVNVDGKNEEWQDPLRYYDSNTKLQYSLSNNTEFLYLCFKITDKSTQHRILQAGLEIGIDTTGKIKNISKICFPLQKKNKIKNISPQDIQDTTIKTQKYHSGGFPNRGIDIPSGNFQKIEHDKMLGNVFIKKVNTMMLLTGFRCSSKTPVSITQNECGISVGINKDSNGIMYYEASIPFKAFYKEYISLSDSTKIFGLSIEIKEAKELVFQNGEAPPERGDRKIQDGGRPNGGMPRGGGMPSMKGDMGGGMPEGRPSFGGREGGEQNENNRLKFRFKLAVKQK